MATTTEHQKLTDASFRIGEWLVEPRLNRLTRGDESIQIELKMMDVLVCLAEWAGELVTRREITDTVWATEFITEKTLTRAVAELRRTLGDDAKQPRYIETIHRKGYCLISPVEAVEKAATVTPFPAPAVTIEDDRSPYPGLTAFTEADADLFFGREAEVTQLWRKITTRRLLALIGPSGVGKSSLLRAGLLPASPEGWGSLIFSPGESAFRALARALVPVFKGDAQVTAELLDVDTPDRALAIVCRWRAFHQRALLIVDQFEELFTLNSPETQTTFAEALGHLARHADVHVLLSMRDDFHCRCHGYEALSPVFDTITPISTPPRAGLRRALVEPAARFGFAFEDESVLEEMLDVVEGERGALPLLAFTVARLWDERDRERRLLTREMYENLGGVHGALARHAEATVAEIGTSRVPVVRELFRNLVTADGTRAVREVDNLLTVFPAPQRASAETVLGRLIDSRLLTSFEEETMERDSRRRVEVVHETLLSSWPRLVGWQTQDADSARLRDELRQAARTWDEHDRSDDLLWTGSAYREYALWRERYPGGLSETEEAFAAAMTSFARRRKRRRRVAAAAALALFAIVATVFGTLWRRSVRETRRAEAAKLVALAQARLQTDPTEALAFTTASLEVTDTPAARSFVMRALWEAPPAIVLDSRGAPSVFPRFSPDGSAIAVMGFRDAAAVWWDTGDGPLVLDPPGRRAVRGWTAQWISQELLATGIHFRNASAERVFIWSVPEGRLLRTIEFGGPTYWQIEGHRLFTETFLRDPTQGRKILLRSWRLPVGEAEELGSFDPGELGRMTSLFDSSGDAWIYAKGGTIFARPLPMVEGSHDRVIGVHDAGRARVLSHHTMNGGRFMSRDDEGAIRVWSLASPGDGPLRVVSRPDGASEDIGLLLDRTGRWIYTDSASEIGKGLVWDRSAPPGAQPLELRRSGSWQFAQLEVHPKSEWAVATAGGGSMGAAFWPLRKAYPSVVEGASSYRKGLAFSPDGRWLATIWPPGRARLIPLSNVNQAETPKLAPHFFLSNPVFDPAGENLTGGRNRYLAVVPMDGGEPRKLEGFLRETLIEAAAFSPSGRLIAAASGIGVEEYTLRVWDLETGEARVFDLPRSGSSIDSPGESGETAAAVYEDHVQNLWFTDEETLFTIGATRFLKWDLENGSSEEVIALDAVGYRTAAASAGGRKVLMVESLGGGQEIDICATPELFHLEDGTTEALPSFGDCVRVVALDPTGTVAVTGDADGVVRVGRIGGGEPHLLAGHEGAIESVAVSPDLRWVASVGSDTTLRLWPMPELEIPPLHNLPHDVLIAKLKTLTNLRAVRDEASSTGWKIEIGPFPGWETVPEW